MLTTHKDILNVQTVVSNLLDLTEKIPLAIAGRGQDELDLMNQDEIDELRNQLKPLQLVPEMKARLEGSGPTGTATDALAKLKVTQDAFQDWVAQAVSPATGTALMAMATHAKEQIPLKLGVASRQAAELYSPQPPGVCDEMNQAFVLRCHSEAQSSFDFGLGVRTLSAAA